MENIKSRLDSILYTNIDNTINQHLTYPKVEALLNLFNGVISLKNHSHVNYLRFDKNIRQYSKLTYGEFLSKINLKSINLSKSCNEKINLATDMQKFIHTKEELNNQIINLTKVQQQQYDLLNKLDTKRYKIIPNSKQNKQDLSRLHPNQLNFDELLNLKNDIDTMISLLFLSEKSKLQVEINNKLSYDMGYYGTDNIEILDLQNNTFTYKVCIDNNKYELRVDLNSISSSIHKIGFSDASRDLFVISKDLNNQMQEIIANSKTDV